MLRALELIGFKSFANKTRFEFPAGITTIVGPNGSGKSNIVDAIKWVLGEQSVKNLRGREMADVIFNGSGTRRAMNSAEVTLTLDNSGGLLPIDTPRVHITRRVYRSGEGEYLINRQPSRLRDIRDLLSGTGMGTQAYSVIEQGKVDLLLQASARERRIIFEEAAGISRFKAKKLEALRRLDRVEQNLLRLSDIVDEVENRLRGVRSQAGKARRYRQYTNRLQELCTQVGLVDWQQLSQRLAGHEHQIGDLALERDGQRAEAESLEARLLETETRLGEITEGIRRSEARIADNRERIAAQESTIEHERGRTRDLEEEIARERRRLAALSTRAGDLETQLRQSGEELEEAQQRHRRCARAFAEGERGLTELIGRLDHFRAEAQQSRNAQMEKMRAAAALGKQISGLESRAAWASQSRGRCQQRLTELEQALEELVSAEDALRRRCEVLEREAAERAERVEGIEARLDEHRGQAERRRSELVEWERRQSGMAERAGLLDELLRRHEGLSPGVKEVLEQARQAEAGPFAGVRGLVADLFEVGVEAAALVETALGEVAQYVVVDGRRELIEHVKRHSHELSGRVGFVAMESAGRPDAGDGPSDLEDRPGVVGRADRFVEARSEYLPLAQRLLGRTWIVESLDDALALSPSAPEVRFVTLKSELIEPDGRLVVGPRQGATGQITRRSELRALRKQLEDVDREIDNARAAIQQSRERIAAEEARLETASQARRQSLEALVETRQKIAAAQQRGSHLQAQREKTVVELEDVVGEHDRAEAALAGSRRRAADVERELATVEEELGRVNEQIDGLDAQRQWSHRETTEAKVELAKSEERLRNLRARMRQFQDSRQERLRTVEDCRRKLAQCHQRWERSRWGILRAESEVAELYLRKEAFRRQTVELIEARQANQRERVELKEAAGRCRSKVHKLEERIHAVQLAANEVRLQRNSLAGRLREDYGVELAELEHEPTEQEQQQREEVQQEIDELRRKINNLGNVNLEALEELEQLEQRHRTLAGQFQDLSSAKASLERIIDKINTDSRRLFAQMLETVRGHFRTLFRDLFGGGQADIVLEEDADVLDCGIEIVARPPGKEPRNISLLSGGEKTLTCVALLLAIFRSRPSPFCVLDEVDAALDEANIDRFTGVLRAFLTWTQFIIVTHSKKTMTCADTIYGVTMQESGVSKPVSVRFEDVSENGEILSPPGAAGEAPPPKDEGIQAA